MLFPWVRVLGLLSGLTVETGSPDALCPDVPSVEAAIAARVGELEGDAAAWRVRYTMVHAPDSTVGDLVRLQIHDPANELRLSRDLPLTSESCATMAQAVALVVERFFRAMVGERTGELERSVASAPTPGERDTGVVRQREHEPADREQSGAIIVAAQVGALGPPVRPTFGSLFVIRGTRPVSLAASVGFVLVPWTQELERGGEAHLQAGLLRLTPAWDFTLADARVALGLTLSMAVERAWTTGLPVSDDQYRAVSAAGGALSFRVALGSASAVDVSAVVEAPFRPFGGRFMIDGEETLEPPAVRSAFTLGWGAAWPR